MLHDRPNSELLKEMNNLVYGHLKAKKALINLVNRARVRQMQKWGEEKPEEELINTSKIMLIGPSGTGKTFLVDSLQRLVNFPLLKIDATRLNHTGAGSGGIKPADLERMIEDRARLFMATQASQGIPPFSVGGCIDQTVVFVDEFDKISSHYDGSSNNWNESTQSHLLTLIDNYGPLSGVSWIFAGAFSGIKEEFNKSKSLGFTAIPESESDEGLMDEDLIKYGMLPEVIGRMTGVIELDSLSEKDYLNILNKVILPSKMSEMEFFGFKDHGLKKKQIKEMAKGAAESGLGVRFLKREIENHFRDAEFNYEDYKYID